MSNQSVCTSPLTISLSVMAWVAGGIWLTVWPAELHGQDDPYLASYSDSLSEENDSDEIFYQIELLRFERWARENTHKLADPVLLNEVVRLKKEAEVFAQNNDYTLALIWMETIWDVLAPMESLDPEDEAIELMNGSDTHSSFTGEPIKKFNWSKELITGVDIWRQEFQFNFLQSDSTYLQGSGNPYSGIRLNLEYTPASRHLLQTFAFFKYSRDYLTGDFEIRLRNPLGRSYSWHAENRLEVSSFYGDFDLQYLQNRSTLAFDFRRVGPFSLDFRDEFLIRNYDNSASSLAAYPDYFNNQFYTFAKAHTGVGSFIGAGYSNALRIHPDLDANDYYENRVDVSWYQTAGQEISFAVDNQLSFRNYPNITNDTTIIFQDYIEDYLRGQLRLPFNAVVGIEGEGTLTKRDYKTQNFSFPDFLFWEIEPRLFVKLGMDWEVAAGMFYGRLTQQKFNQATAASIDNRFEDYVEYGPAVELEFFKINHIMFNLRYAFLLKSNPNEPARNVTLVPLSSDRRINSLLFFLTWTISPRWRFSTLANMDDDRSRLARDNSDSNSTLVGFELNYIF